MSNERQVILPKKKYAPVVIIKYSMLVLQVLLLFMPVLRISSISPSGNAKLTASISPLQYIMGNTESEVKISGDVSEIQGDPSNLRVDVKAVICQGGEAETLYNVLRIVVLIFAPLTALITPMALSGNAEVISRPATSIWDMQVKDDAYINSVYTSFPRILEFFSTLFGIMGGGSIMMFGGSVLFSNFMNGQTQWKINGVFFIACLLVAGAISNKRFIKWIFAKDCKIIKEKGARFDMPYIPTFTSDWSAAKLLLSTATDDSPEIAAPQSMIYAGCVVSQKELPITQAQVSTKEIKQSQVPISPNVQSQDECVKKLYKYKQYVDEGIISPEEYQQLKSQLVKKMLDREKTDEKGENI